MTSPELIQSAVTAIHQARELFDAGAKTNLLQTLMEQGHPYGLLLGQSSGPSEDLLNFFFPPKKGEAKAFLKSTNGFSHGMDPIVLTVPCSWPILPIRVLAESVKSGGPFLAGASSNASAINSIFSGEKSASIPENIREDSRSLVISENEIREFINYDSLSVSKNEEDRRSFTVIPGLVTPSLSKGSILGSAKHNPDSARKIHMEQLFTQQAFLAPIFLKALAGEKESSERTRNLEIGKGSVSLGTTCIKLTTYKGEQPFVVKTPQGEAIAEINPGDQLGHLHVSHQAAFMRDLTPLEKSQRIIEDFIDLFKFVDQSEGFGLDQKQQETVNRARNATLIGISHLVRLFRRKTGLPTWKLDVLPELVQRFHQHDSQAVSKAFGGTRKVKTEDVEMMVITPAMRQQLVATI